MIVERYWCTGVRELVQSLPVRATFPPKRSRITNTSNNTTIRVMHTVCTMSFSVQSLQYLRILSLLSSWKVTTGFLLCKENVFFFSDLFSTCSGFGSISTPSLCSLIVTGSLWSLIIGSNILVALLVLALHLLQVVWKCLLNKHSSH